MPIYEFNCTRCNVVTTEILPIGTRATKCPECGCLALLVLSIPAKPQIKHETCFSKGFPAPSLSNGSHASSLENDNSVRVYDFEFGSYEKEKLNYLANKEMLGGLSDGYSVS